MIIRKNIYKRSVSEILFPVVEAVLCGAVVGAGLCMSNAVNTAVGVCASLFLIVDIAIDSRCRDITISILAKKNKDMRERYNIDSE